MTDDTHTPRFSRINGRPLRSAIRLGIVIALATTIFAVPVAATQSSTAPNICDSSKLTYLINSIIQLAIYGGVGLGAAMYVGAEAAENRFASQEQTETIRQIKRNGIGKMIKLSAIPVLLSLLIKGSPLAWKDCITLVPF